MISKECFNEVSILFDGLMKGYNTIQLINLGFKVLNNPILLTNSSYRIIAMSDNPDIDDSVWKDAKKYGCCSDESIEIFKRDAASNILYNSSHAFIYKTGLGKKIPRILRKITIGQKAVGYICIFESNCKFQDKHLEIVDVLCNLLAIEMKMDCSAGDFTDVVYESLIYDLLENKIKSDISINERLKSANWSIKNMLCVLKVEIKNEGNNLYYCDYIKNQLEQAITPFSKAIVFHESIIVLINCSNTREYEYELSQIKKVLVKTKVQAGKSRIFFNLSDLSDNYKEADSALKFGKAIDSESILYKYEDYFWFSMISKMNTAELKSLYHPGYSKLLKYDTKNETEYCRTLYEYFLNANNISKTAELLHIHRNTMAYRIEKIQDIIDIDLSSGEEISHFLLTEKIDKWLKSAKNIITKI